MSMEYAYCSDVLCELIPRELFLMIRTGFQSIGNDGKHNTYYNEYTLSNNTTMIKRKLNCYLYFDNRRDIPNDRVLIYQENMFELLNMFKVAQSWLYGYEIFGYVDGALRVITPTEVKIRLPFDKSFRIEPGLIIDSNGVDKCLDFYVNTQEPFKVTINAFNAMYYLLSNLDMAGYANSTMIMMLLNNQAVNRISYNNSNGHYSQQQEEPPNQSQFSQNRLVQKPKNLLD